MRGSTLIRVGGERRVAHTVASGRQAFIWPYDKQARLFGENLYEDKTSVQVEEVDPAEAITPARAAEIHRQRLAKLEAERGDQYWVLGEPDGPGHDGAP